MLAQRSSDSGPPRQRQIAFDTVTSEAPQNPVCIEIQSLSLWYGSTQALRSVSLIVPERQVTALIGPSGCGKSSLLRCLNRMNDLIPGVRVSGGCRVGGVDVQDPQVDVTQLRRRVGMIFQKSNPFPQSVFDNVAFGLRIGGCSGSELEGRVASALRRAALWDEVRDRLDENALRLSGGQQQRLCIARAVAVEPEVLLMDEPASALDPVSVGRIEDLIRELREDYTILMVTHHMQQAARLSDQTAFLHQGELVEVDRTDRIFSQPRDPRTEDYVTGRFS
jgi:phosphate transport system ATP-binding protein